MGKYDSPEIRRLQRKLIPLNIVIAIISLVAAISLMFTPFIRINCGKLIDAVSDTVKEEVEGDENSDMVNTVVDNLSTSLSGVEMSFSTYSLGKLAFSENAVAAMIKEYVFSDEVVDAVIVNTIYTSLLTSDSGITQEQLDQVDVDGLMDIVSQLEEEDSDPDEVSEQLYNEINTQLENAEIEAEISQEDVSRIVNEMYDKVVENNDGSFSKEALICIAYSEYVGSDVVYTTYDELIENLLNSGSVPTSDSDNSSKAAAAYSLTETEENTEETPDENTGENTDENTDETVAELQQTVTLVLKVWFGVMMFYVLIWLILFLFAIFHLFAGNKRFVMWYAKLFGATPCILFWLAPMLFTVLAPSIETLIDAEMFAMLSGVVGALSSFAWISGICYLLMWICSIFWAFPIKRKIRKLLKNN